MEKISPTANGRRAKQSKNHSLWFIEIGAFLVRNTPNSSWVGNNCVTFHERDLDWSLTLGNGPDPSLSLHSPCSLAYSDRFSACLRSLASPWSLLFSDLLEVMQKWERVLGPLGGEYAQLVKRWRKWGSNDGTRAPLILPLYGAGHSSMRTLEYNELELY